MGRPLRTDPLLSWCVTPSYSRDQGTRGGVLEDGLARLPLFAAGGRALAARVRLRLLAQAVLLRGLRREVGEGLPGLVGRGARLHALLADRPSRDLRVGLAGERVDDFADHLDQRAHFGQPHLASGNAIEDNRVPAQTRAPGAAPMCKQRDFRRHAVPAVVHGLLGTEQEPPLLQVDEADRENDRRKLAHDTYLL